MKEKIKRIINFTSNGIKITYTYAEVPQDIKVSLSKYGRLRKDIDDNWYLVPDDKLKEFDELNSFSGDDLWDKFEKYRLGDRDYRIDGEPENPMFIIVG